MKRCQGNDTSTSLFLVYSRHFDIRYLDLSAYSQPNSPPDLSVVFVSYISRYFDVLQIVYLFCLYKDAQ